MTAKIYEFPSGTKRTPPKKNGNRAAKEPPQPRTRTLTRIEQSVAEALDAACGDNERGATEHLNQLIYNWTCNHRFADVGNPRTRHMRMVALHGDCMDRLISEYDDETTPEDIARIMRSTAANHRRYYRQRRRKKKP